MKRHGILIGDQVVTQQDLQNATDLQRMGWRWNATVAAHNAAAAFADLLGKTWTGRVMQVAS